ncbi:uroporphyrinogen-III synthase [Actinomadura keratinilytica]|jgi:uroporphyrinogen III methyltransferase/synthase|uniref:Tetrapyrrole biosynthesis uroporphyrinogen III synthase domain-containing protein n=1 Tax=Actinomadura keratinilytica TaxID=547461 RepID=A0ABP7Z9Q0_9ACTN
MQPVSGAPPCGRLDGWHVLVPRAAHQAGELSRWLRRYGAVPWEVAMIDVEPPRCLAPLDRALARLREGGYAWVVFTSANAVRAVGERLAARGLDGRALNTARVAAVGDRTAAELVRLGARVDLVPGGEQSAEGLLACEALRPAPGAPGRVLLPRSDIARDTLAAGLSERGWRCDAVVAYRTVAAAPPPADVVTAVADGRFDAVAFTSSSTVRNLLALAAAPPPSTVVAAIGRQTAETAREHGLRVHAIARRPSAGGLAAALAGYAASSGHVPPVRDAPFPM